MSANHYVRMRWRRHVVYEMSTFLTLFNAHVTFILHLIIFENTARLKTFFSFLTLYNLNVTYLSSFILTILEEPLNWKHLYGQSFNAFLQEFSVSFKECKTNLMLNIGFLKYICRAKFRIFGLHLKLIYGQKEISNLPHNSKVVMAYRPLKVTPHFVHCWRIEITNDIEMTPISNCYAKRAYITK